MTRLPRRPLLAGIATGLLPATLRAQPAELRLGALYPVSGPQALLGDESLRGLELAIEERNAAGGLLARPIRLLKADATDAPGAIAEARRLLGERAAAIFGTQSTTLAIAASQIAELAGTPYFELGAVGDAVTERGFRNLYRSCARMSDIAATAIEAISETLGPALGTPAPRIAILAEDSGYGQGMAGVQEAALRARNLAAVERLGYPGRALELGSIVQRLRAAGPDIVLHSGFAPDIALFFRALQEANWRPRVIIGSGAGYSLTETAQAVGAPLENTLNIDFSPFGVSERFAPGAAPFIDTYKSRYGSEPRSAHSLVNYTGAVLFLDAVQRAGSLDRERIRAAILATDIGEGTTPAGWGARFDERGQNTLARPFLLQWQGGRLRTVAPAAAAVAPLRV